MHFQDFPEIRMEFKGAYFLGVERVLGDGGLPGHLLGKDIRERIRANPRNPWRFFVATDYTDLPGLTRIGMA